MRAAEPATFDPRMRVDYTGGIAQAIDEQNGIRDDLTLATLLVHFLVVLSPSTATSGASAILWVVGAPAVLGLLLSLTIASLTISYLNINTAFLISIILGNGINSPIILLGALRRGAAGGQARDAGAGVGDDPSRSPASSPPWRPPASPTARCS